jgi:predicted Zn-dependent protease with MMP-like domain
MPRELETILDDAYEALYATDANAARRLLDEARGVDSRARDVLLLEVDVFELEGAGEEAIAACEEALKSHKRDMVLMFRWATLLLDFYDDVPEALPALEDVHKRLQGGEEPSLPGRPDDADARDDAILDFALEVALALADCRADALDPEGALAAAQAAVELDADDPAARLARAGANFELGRLDDAEKGIGQAIDRDPKMPEAYWLRGRVLTVTGDEAGANRAFERACALDPDAFQMPIRISEDELAAQMESILAEMPEAVREHLDNVVIAIEDVPDLERLAKADPPQSPGILGYFDPGAPTAAHDEPRLHRTPDHVTLFRKNLEITARDEEDLREQVRITLLHEIGHYLGLDEDDLFERGLD